MMAVLFCKMFTASWRSSIRSSSLEPRHSVRFASVPSLLTRHVRVASLTVTAPRVYVARLTPTEFDFSDLLALIPPADPNAMAAANPNVARVMIPVIASTGKDGLFGLDDTPFTSPYMRITNYDQQQDNIYSYRLRRFGARGD